MGVAQKSSCLEKSQAWYLIGARYYDADIGMWTQPDAMRQFASPYAYAGNGFNPISAVDPDGNYFVKKIGSGDDAFYTIQTNSRLNSYSGHAVKIVGGAYLSAKYLLVGVLFGVGSAMIDEYNANKNYGDALLKEGMLTTAGEIANRTGDTELPGKVFGNLFQSFFLAP